MDITQNDVKEFEIPHAEDDLDPLCSQCLSIFCRETNNLFPYWNTEGHLITVQNEPDSNCALCSLLFHRLFDNIRSEAEDQLKAKYWLENREGFLYGGCYVHFEAAVHRQPGDQKTSLNLGVHGLDIPDDTRGYWSGKNDGRTDSSQVAILQIPPWVRNLAASTSSPKSLQQADAWMNDCLSNHAVCRSINEQSDFNPKRLIEVDRQGPSPCLRLCDTSTLRQRVKYMTLSHCWGTKTISKLEKIRYPEFSKNIPLASLPKAFQDAIYIAGRAGIDYLWIDSLCVIQDSKEDWINESETMGQIYRHGVCNIASTGFADGSNGLFATREPSNLRPIQIHIPNDISIDGRNATIKKGRQLLIDVDMWAQGVETAPLNQRGWVMQERSLSVRTLHFGPNQLFWECVEAKGSETFPVKLLRGMPRTDPKFFIRPNVETERVRERYLRDDWRRSKDGITPSPIRGMTHAHKRWRTVVEQYSGCALTYGHDKLVAISGLAREISPSMGCAYFAGLWRRDMEHQLLWKCIKPQPEIDIGNIPTRGPSWSWASVDGKVEISHWEGYVYPEAGDVKWLAKVTNVETQHMEMDSFGQCSSGVLTMSGSLGVMLIIPGDVTDPSSDSESEESYSPDRYYGQVLDEDHALISWDTLPLSKRFGVEGMTRVSLHREYYRTDYGSDSQDVFFMPIRIMDEDPSILDYEEPTLKGLLLLPTRQRKGEYRRVGLFEVSEQWSECPSVKIWDHPTRIDNAELYQAKGEGGQYTITII